MSRGIAYPIPSRFTRASSRSSFAISSGSLSAITSTTSSASGSPSMKSVIREYARLLLACRMIMLPMSSTAAGSISSVATVASMDSMRSLK